MADFRDFFLEFINEKALTKGGSFTEDEVVAWFKDAHPDRTPTHIHHQLLKKTTNYPGRVGYIPTARATDDLFFALDPEFHTFRLYRQQTDPLPYYVGKVSKESVPKAELTKEQHRFSGGVSIKPNALYRADCLKLLERISSKDVTLVYLDPPSFSDDKGSAGQSDYHSPADFLKFITLVVKHSRRILKESGSLFFHSEPRTTPKIRPILEEVFGNQNFLNEFIWPRKAVGHSLSSRARSEHDTIFHYGKTDSVIYHPQYRVDGSIQKLAKALVGKDERGQFLSETLTSTGLRPSKQFSWRGFSPPTGRSWRFSEEQLDQFVSDNRIIFPPDGRMPVYKRYVDEQQEVGSVWDDIRPVAETVGDFNYPTQKPVELVDRIIRMSTAEQDTVVDPFCGAGTTLIAAQQNHRGWIGGDSLNEACSITIARLEKAFQLRPGIDFIFEDQTHLDDFIPHMVYAGKPIADIRYKRENTPTALPDSHESQELSEALRFAIENKFPYPIAKPFEQLRGCDEWRSEISQLANIVGASVEYLAIIAVAEYGALEKKDASLSEAFARDFKMPLSYGGWAGVLRRVLSYMRDQECDIAVPELLTSYFSTRGESTPGLEERINELVRLRNELIKRAAERTPSRTEHVRLKKGLIDLLKELSFLEDYPLVTILNSSTEAGVKRHNCSLHMGARGMFEKIRLESDLDIESNRVAILNLAKRELVYLHPFYLLRECPQCSVVHLFRFDRLDGKRAEYIGPDGHNLRNNSARDDLMELVAGQSSSGCKKRARYLSTEFSNISAAPPVPTRIGKYRVVCPIRPGGMADVYKVQVPGDDEMFALKLLPYQFFRDPTVVRRFRLEAKQARSLRHPNIVHVFDYGEQLSEHYLVMELAPGWNINKIEDALDVSDLPKPLAKNTALSIIKQACEGLDYIHQNRIIHRDVKPGNLLLFPEDRVKLSDFGIARSAESITLTMTGLNVGTPEYSSPEQAEGRHDLTFASDIYSLGIVMFELLTGTSPFKRATPMSTLMAHLKDPVPNPSLYGKVIPKELASIVMKCLQKDPTERYPTAKTLLNALVDYGSAEEDKPDKHYLPETERTTAHKAWPKRRVWSDYWFVNVGEGRHRNWDDNRRYGYLSAGGGVIYSRGLKRLELGDKIFAYLNGLGYVGYGVVTHEAVMIKDFYVGEEPKTLLELPLRATKAGANRDDPELCEWAIGVKWLRTYSREDAKRLKGVPVYRNVVCQLKHSETIEFLEQEFEVRSSDNTRVENEVDVVAIEHMLKRIPKLGLQRDLLTCLYEAGDEGLTNIDLAARMNCSRKQVADALGALGTRIKGTEALSNKRGLGTYVEILLDVRQLNKSDWHFKAKPVLRKALEIEGMVGHATVPHS